MLCCPHCLRLSTMVNNIVTRHSASTILFNGFNVVNSYKQCGQQLLCCGSTTLFNPVELQTHDFLPCRPVIFLFSSIYKTNNIYCIFRNEFYQSLYLIVNRYIKEYYYHICLATLPECIKELLKKESILLQLGLVKLNIVTLQLSF